MSSAYTVKMYDSDGNCRVEEVCFYFRLIRDVYTPYVYFECRFASSFEKLDGFNRVEFWIYNSMIHKGLVDTIDIRRSGNSYTVFVRSKGFTSLLCQNQPEPGKMDSVNLQKIITLFPDIPYITCENSRTENYIYIKDGSTLWDAVCNLSFRQNNTYPYIEKDNNVRITLRNPTINLKLKDKNIIAAGVRHDFTKVISNIHMQDIQGNYDVYSKGSQAAADRNIIRHKQIPLDRQFLYNPESALDYKLGFGMRGSICNYVRYAGYNYEQLFDTVSYGEFAGKKIHKVDVIYNGGNLSTLLEMYDDGFFSS